MVHDDHRVRTRGGSSRTRINDIQRILGDRLSRDTTDSSGSSGITGAILLTDGLAEARLMAITAEWQKFMLFCNGRHID